jgi:hypothetical protein
VCSSASAELRQARLTELSDRFEDLSAGDAHGSVGQQGEAGEQQNQRSRLQQAAPDRAQDATVAIPGRQPVSRSTRHQNDPSARC